MSSIVFLLYPNQVSLNNTYYVSSNKHFFLKNHLLNAYLVSIMQTHHFHVTLPSLSKKHKALIKILRQCKAKKLNRALRQSKDSHQSTSTSSTILRRPEEHQPVRSKSNSTNHTR